MATLNVGRVRLLCKGEYSPESAYDFFDWVTYDGSSYVVTAPTGSPAGVLPTDSNYWSLLASKGETGEMGEPGAGVFAGQLVMSLVPIFSAGLHLLDGSLLRVGGIYDDFITGVAVLRVSHPALFVTEEEWQASVSAYGVCGKFVYTEGVSLRIPKVTGFVEGTLDVTALGSLVEAGLPNIEGRFSAGNASLVSGALYNAGVVANGVGTTEAGFTPVVGFSAANSSPIYGNSNTVQPQAIKGYMYMVVATSVKTEVEVDIDNIAQELSDLQDAIDAIPEQVNSDWEEEDETAKTYIRNKPVVMTGATAETAGEQGFVPAPAAGDQDSVLKGDGTWGSIPSRNIGETVFSLLPQTDAGLHLLDGSLLSVGGIYDEFITYVAALQADYPNLFTTESAWQSSVSTYGVCGKFVYTEGASLRIPKITGFVEGTLDANAIGDLVEAGLPNIGGSFQGDSLRVNSVAFFNCTGAFSREQVSGAFAQYAEASTGGTTQVNFNASRSNSIYGNSSTVQPQAIKGYLYMVVATSTKTNVQVDIDNIATDLNAKADKDLSNVTSAAASSLNTVGARTVTETYSDGTNWYRKWSDGWIEQGGGALISARSSVTVTFLIAHTTAPRVLVSSGAAWSGGTNYAATVGVNARTTTGFTVIQPTEDSPYWTGFNWYAMGY